jgi:glutamate-5-semialdehyde dehydrogenase
MVNNHKKKTHMNSVQVQKKLKKFHESSSVLVTYSQKAIDTAIINIADTLVKESVSILSANRKDLKKISPEDPKYDRLLLNEERVVDMAEGLRSLTKLTTPVGEILEERVRPNGLHVSRVRVPIGSVGIIYEARPNVTTDAFGIAFKTRNAVALKGGKEAYETNKVLVSHIQRVLKEGGIPEDCVYLLPWEPEATEILLTANGSIDVVIPRGGKGLISFVQKTATVPVIETGAGVVHTYFDREGNVDLGRRIIFSAKTRRPSVCNALDTLIVHKNRLKDLPALVGALAEKNVIIYADPESYKMIAASYPKTLLKKASKEHFGKEFLDYAMSIKTVDDLDEALSHIASFSSHHSESIITDNTKNAERFLRDVDSACVYHNTETGFSDGGELGLGAEIGISTQKLHARGPMGLVAMTSYKWIVRGEGQTRMKVE